MAKRPKVSSSSPFSVLKGLASSLPPASPPPKAVAPSAPSLEESFDAAMARLGVKPIATPAEEPSPVAPPPEAPGAITLPDDEQSLFLGAMGGMTPLFADSLDEPPAATAQARRMKRLRQGVLRPEATLDLHGLTREAARQKVRWFLDDACYHGCRVVLIITGQGKSSGGEAILRDTIERYLSHEARAWVAEWGRAPGNLGGAGALVVFLRGGRATPE